jgi:two-component system, LuxR family, response regulator FixJ
MANNCKVLIVDDDKGVRASLAALLRTAVLEVETFGSGQEFLQAWTPECYGCVLIDVRMPGMSGLQLQTQLAERGITLPVIVITGHADVPMAVAAMRAGAVDFIEKPFNDAAIISSVQRALEIGIKLRDDGLSAAALKARIAQLTMRERDVFLQVVAGKPNKVIAHELCISVRTVEVYRARVMEKLNASNLPQLSRMALVAGIG